MTQYIYLSGQITGATYEEARYGWRSDVTRAVDHMFGGRVKCLSPMRCKAHLANVQDAQSLSPFGDATHPLSTPDAIVARDRMDTKRASLVFLNYLGMKKISFGCAVELGWADAFGVPVLVCIEPEGNPNDHAMLVGGGMTGWRCTSLEQGLEVVKGIFSEGL